MNKYNDEESNRNPKFFRTVSSQGSEYTDQRGYMNIPDSHQSLRYMQASPIEPRDNILICLSHLKDRIFTQKMLMLMNR